MTTLDPRGTVRGLMDDGRGPMLLVIAGGWFLSIGVRMMYPALLPYIRVAYDLDLAAAGLLLGVLWFAYALGQLPGGILSDRVGEGMTMGVSTLIAGTSLAAVMIAQSSEVLFLATGLFGFATALYGIARFTALADIYPDQVGTATGVTMAAGDVGNSVLPPIAVFIGAKLAWQYGFGFVLPLFLPVAVGFLIVIPARTSDPADVTSFSAAAVTKVLRELRQSSIVQATAILIIGSCIWQAVTGFYPTYLVEIKGLSPTTAGVLFGVFFLLGVVIKPIAGSAYDWIGVRRSLVGITVGIVVSLVVLPLVEGLVPLIGATVLVSSILGYSTVTLSYLTATITDEVRGIGLGLLRTVYSLIAALSPVAFGAMADRGFFDEGFYLLALLASVMLLIALRLPEHEAE